MKEMSSCVILFYSILLKFKSRMLKRNAKSKSKEKCNNMQGKELDSD
jgi:hypothetical protein